MIIGGKQDYVSSEEFLQSSVADNFGAFPSSLTTPNFHDILLEAFVTQLEHSRELVFWEFPAAKDKCKWQYQYLSFLISWVSPPHVLYHELPSGIGPS